MPAERSKSVTVTCELCGKQFKQAGLAHHRKACSRKTQRTQEDIAFTEALQRGINDLNRAGGGNPAHPVPGPTTSAQNLQGHGLDDQWALDEHTGSVNDIEGPESPVTLPAQYELDDIHTEYHPHSSLPSVTKCFSDFSREHFVMPPPPDLDRDPWHPFRCRLDFEVAELALEAALTKDQTSRLIKLLQRVAYKREKFSLKDYKDLRQTWDAVGHRVTPFQKELISVPYRDEPEPRTFNMWHRPLWDWACDLLKDPRVGPHFVFDAQRLSKFNGRSFVHFIDEPWTAGDFWDFQVCCKVFSDDISK